MLEIYHRNCGRALRESASPHHSHLDPPSQLDSVAEHQADAESKMRERTFSALHLFGRREYASQTESGFFARLPLEIRCQIYSYVLPHDRRLWVRLLDAKRSDRTVGGSSQHKHRKSRMITLQHARIEHFPCEKPPSDNSFTVSTGGCCSSSDRGFWGRVATNHSTPHQDSLSLMKTCGRMYESFRTVSHRMTLAETKRAIGISRQAVYGHTALTT